MFLQPVSYTHLSYVERQIRMPTLDTLLRMADALQLDLTTILTEAIKLCK